MLKRLIILLLSGSIAVLCTGCTLSASQTISHQDMGTEELQSYFEESIAEIQEEVDEIQTHVEDMKVTPQDESFAFWHERRAFDQDIYQLQRKIDAILEEVTQDLADGLISQEGYDSYVEQLEQLGTRCISLRNSAHLIFALSMKNAKAT